MSKTVYLCGPMQDAKDSGEAWRAKLTPKLLELGLTVFDPCKSEANLGDGTIDASKKAMAGWLAAGHRELFLSHMRKVKEDDLRMVSESDFLIVYIDQAQRPGGTIAEIHEAWKHGKPIYAVTYDAIKDLNHWVLSDIWDVGQLFDNWTQLIEFLTKEYGATKTQDKSLVSRVVTGLQEIGKQLSPSK